MLETNDACWEATGYGGETILYDCGLAAGFACCRIEDQPSCATNALLIAYHGKWCGFPTAWQVGSGVGFPHAAASRLYELVHRTLLPKGVACLPLTPPRIDFGVPCVRAEGGGAFASCTRYSVYPGALRSVGVPICCG